MIINDSDNLRYDQMVERALRNVVKESLQIAATTGLQGDHHFYISFRTRFPGVQISPAQLARYPDEMTIVLQHQFWDLDVADDFFGVTLSFSGVSERLIVPYPAIVGFSDPSAKFGLQFQVEEEPLHEDEPPMDDATVSELESVPFRAAEEDLPEGGAKVIALDAFRKK